MGGEKERDTHNINCYNPPWNKRRLFQINILLLFYHLHKVRDEMEQLHRRKMRIIITNYFQISSSQSW